MTAAKPPIYVTRPFLPALEEFLPYLERIWQSHHLTNAGPFHQEFESALADFLGVEHVSLFANGTLALLTALQALRIAGDVITTPFSFVATSHVLTWNRLRPVFVDIEPETFNLDPEKIRAAITPETTAILPVHVYGTPCNIGRIAEIAAEHNLRVIYDAAHAFGVGHHGRNVAAYGDLSVLSFHATKVFNTFEGGAIVSRTPEMKLRIDRLKNFGFADEVTVIEPGINGKMNEFQAALGLLQLKHVDAAIARRRAIHELYCSALADTPGIVLPARTDDHNFSYFPLQVGAGYALTRDALYEHLKTQGIFSRRYFYPLISEFPMYRSLSSAQSHNLPNASAAAKAVLCLPIYPDLPHEEALRVAGIVRGQGRRVGGM
jgi:dTDP-4-amino-4,6-dideoxygalactose transaminase